MEPSLPKKTTFSVEEEEWLETLRQMLAGNQPRTVWVFLRSTAVTLYTRPYRCQLQKQTLHLLAPPQSPSGPSRIECLVGLPPQGYAWYYRRTNEKRDIRLNALYRVTRDGDRPTRADFAELVIATSEEFLRIEESEVHLQ